MFPFKLCLLSMFTLGRALCADPVVPPAPPECLTRPVTLGSVTLSCTALDATSENGSNAYSYGSLLLDSVLFQVKAASTDPDVIGFRIGLTYEAIPATPTVPAVSITDWGSVGKSTQASTQAGFKPRAVSPGFRFTFFIAAGAPVTGIEVQELKAATSQKF